MFDYAQLQTLATVIRLGSFDAAASSLGLTQSAVSQRIRALEDRVGAVLVIRGQPCRATETGGRLARHLETVALLEQALTPGTSAPARVRIAVNADSLATWFLPALAKATGLLYDLVLDDQDHSADWLRRGEVAAAVTGHRGPVQGCDSHDLGHMRYVATASPDFVATWFADGVTADSLARAPAMTFNEKDRLQRDWVRAVAGRDLTLPTHLIPASQGFADAARLGIGWGMNPLALVQNDLDSGRLKALLPDHPLDVALYWQVARRTGPALAPLTRAVRAAARSLTGA
jgi:LysR family transcriptional regulator (chromosome initiation inhibitor)